MHFYTDQEFLDEYFDHINFIWWEFENKKISNKEREALLAPYRARLYRLHKEGKIGNDQFRLAIRTKHSG